MLEVIIGGMIGIISAVLVLLIQIKVENRRREEDRKEEMRKREEDKKDDERKRAEDKKTEYENNRRELLVTFIRDEHEKIEVRKEAAREYLSKNYNGLIKRYIYENGLNIETKNRDDFNI